MVVIGPIPPRPRRPARPCRNRRASSAQNRACPIRGRHCARRCCRFRFHGCPGLCARGRGNSRWQNNRGNKPQPRSRSLETSLQTANVRSTPCRQSLSDDPAQFNPNRVRGAKQNLHPIGDLLTLGKTAKGDGARYATSHCHGNVIRLERGCGQSPSRSTLKNPATQADFQQGQTSETSAAGPPGGTQPRSGAVRRCAQPASGANRV